MLKCWCYDQDERPSFHYMLGQLETFKERVEDPLSELYRMSTQPSHRGKTFSETIRSYEAFSLNCVSVSVLFPRSFCLP